MTARPSDRSDFSRGSMPRLILRQAIPLTLAELVHLLYNIVDRIYIGHLPSVGSMALTGLGVTFPITMLITAFTRLFGAGGTPLFAIARGAGQEERARDLQGCSLALLLAASAAVFFVCYFFRRPILYFFGAGDNSFAFADRYLRISLWGTVFTMIASGMNGFINAQGFPRMGMMTVLLGAGLNIALDPLFIFVLDMSVEGAALATVLSQAISCLWVVRFITGKKAVIPVRPAQVRIRLRMAGEIVRMGLAGFIMAATNTLTQVACNVTLRAFGGEIWVGVMAILHSVRDVLLLPVSGVTGAAQPVIGFNYGAKLYERVKKGIRFMAFGATLYTLIAWLSVLLFSGFFAGIFTEDPQILSRAPAAMRIYFFGFFFMAFQNSGQSTFTALGRARKAIFFSLLRKAVIVTPLTFLLPYIVTPAVNGVFLAEPISNAIGGCACMLTMLLTEYRKLGKDPVAVHSVSSNSMSK